MISIAKYRLRAIVDIDKVDYTVMDSTYIATFSRYDEAREAADALERVGQLLEPCLCTTGRVWHLAMYYIIVVSIGTYEREIYSTKGATH